ncbi:hypothetical protein EHS25_003264 [Saitozyma podzolica]|uniref:Peptide hydrolase n=1 Tax=Saitozyma podzolica TaxID=1890683 RepID=A0A427Y8H4_9TREE|nr:hypothetical protein EHS25_003264 [Saitozyma podzolica]
MRRALLPVFSAAVASAIAVQRDLVIEDSLLITSHPPAQLADCLRSSYFGTYGGSAATQDHIFLPPPACLLAEDTLSELTSGSLVPLPELEDGARLVWVGPAGVGAPHAQGVMDVDQSWDFISSRAEMLASASSPSEDPADRQGQLVLSAGQLAHPSTPMLQLVHQSPSSLLLHVPANLVPILDTLLPPHLVPVALPLQPLAAGWDPVPDHLVKHLADITANLSFSPALDKILSEGIVMDDIRRNVRWLTGEAPSGIVSRHSFTEGALKAAHWIKDKVEATGATCHLHPFLAGFAPDVICHYPSLLNSTEHIILSAHYDSRGSFGLVRAPGGDDDGSGSGHLLGVAEAVKSQGVQFEKAVTFAFFAGEEQGLYGSHYYAEHLHKQNTTILLQIQADMLAYHAPGEPLQLGLPESIHTPEATYLLSNLSQMYSPELVVGRTAACCSDHQSFVSYGFPATQVFERNGPIVDPMYHNSGDTSQRENYDFSQIVSIAKVTMAAVLTVAGYQVKA